MRPVLASSSRTRASVCSALELGDLAVLHDLDRQGMALGRQVFQDADVGRPRAVLVAPTARQLLLVEQDLAQLLGRADVERPAGELVQLLFELEHALLESDESLRSCGASTLMPACSMPSSTGISGRSIVS